MVIESHFHLSLNHLISHVTNFIISIAATYSCIIGPLLFLIYVNYLLKVTNSASLLFVMDTQVF